MKYTIEQRKEINRWFDKVRNSHYDIEYLMLHPEQARRFAQPVARRVTNASSTRMRTH